MKLTLNACFSVFLFKIRVRWEKSNMMIYEFDLASFRDVNSGVVHIKTLNELQLCQSSSLLPLTLFLKKLPPIHLLASPASSHSVSLFPRIHTAPTRTQFYLLWHLAPDRCSPRSLYLQPLKWVILSDLWFSAELCLQSHLWLPEFMVCWMLEEFEDLVSC